MLTPGIAELAPKPYIGMNPDDLENLTDGLQVEIVIGDWKQQLPVRLMPELPRGLAGLPVGLPGMPALPFPTRGRLGLGTK